jgi:NADH-quinone oxidoreductase subunit F
MGHKVTVFEREKKAGGMLVSAIPEYRLPKAILAAEIASLLNDNIQIQYKKALGKDFTVDSLLKEGYNAVFISTGSHASKKLDLPGENAQGIIPGIKFLKACNLSGKPIAKGKVGVIGGGNSAMDAARVAIRQPDVESVTIFYRRTRESMPAYAEEIHAGLEEGIKLETLVTPVAVGQKDGHLTSMTFLRNELGMPDNSGRRKPVPIKDSEFEAPLDTLIVAISEEPETDGMDGVALTKWGSVEINTESFTTNIKGVFAGGDVVTGPSTVIEAVAAGKKAAVMIDRYVSGKLMKSLNHVKLPKVYVAPVTITESEAETEEVSRLAQPMLSVAKRKGCFAEAELTPSEEQARTEARRCARCDLEFTQQPKYAEEPNEIRSTY